MNRKLLPLGAALLLGAFATPTFAQDSNAPDVAQPTAAENSVEARFLALEQRLAALEAENARLKASIAPASASAVTPAQAAAVQVASATETPAPAYADEGGTASQDRSRGTVGFNNSYAFQMLDNAEAANTKPLVQLAAASAGDLDSRVVLSGGVTAIANQQWSDTDSKFGYLMRHPTTNNQIGKSVSEAVIHSAQLAVTAKLTDSVIAYAEMLYDPQQSFGAGNITALTRNQIQLRRGWVMLGNLDKSPFYALVGKMDVPFGLNETVSPFTNSTNWHAFAGLAYGAQAGYTSENVTVRAMAVQGGAQFRAANVPVQGTSVPSRLNNFAVDARFTLPFGENGNSVMAGASYIHGSAYCQGYPIFHFNPCDDNNPAVAAYGQVNIGPVKLIGEYATTTDEWPGTAVPIPMNPLSQFAAVEAEAFTLGGRFGFGEFSASPQGRKFAVSGEFSKFISGDNGAPWERQNQAVLGFSWFPSESINLFTEFTHVDGWAPLNFLSGGNLPDGSSWSVREADTNVALIGAQVAF